MKVRVALLTGATLLALASVPAFAQSSGPYVGIAGGASWLDDADITGSSTVNSIDFNTGWAAMLKGGYALGNGLRPELELGMRRFGVDGTNNSTAGSGSAKLYTGFANLLYDFMPDSKWTPFLGAGLGVANLKSDVTAGTITSNDSDTTWAGQAIAGVSYAFAPNWLVSADYHYLYLGDTKFGTNTSGVGLEGGNQVHTVMLGLTYRFGAPAPAPMPQPAVAAPPAPKAPPPAPVAAPPAPKVPETYIVFFAFDKSDISPVASQVLDRAVADFKATGMTNVKIEGNADRSGSDKYNQRLSQRRADAVAAYLRGKGIGGSAIQTVANGESKPLVPTADGVRNDENRNAQIFLRK